MDLTSYDILNIILDKFKKENINYFSKNELEKQLMYFSQNSKYSSLFDENFNISNVIDVFIKCGYLYRLNNDDIIYIIRSYDKLNYNVLLEEALDSFCNIKKICNKYNDLNFYIANPNSKYTTLTGNACFHIIKWIVNTDGTINNNIKLIKGTKHTFNSPFDNKKIYFDNADFDIIDVRDSSYVLLQQTIDNEINKNILYTNIINEEKIDNIVKIYCKSR